MISLSKSVGFLQNTHEWNCGLGLEDTAKNGEYYARKWRHDKVRNLLLIYCKLVWSILVI